MNHNTRRCIGLSAALILTTAIARAQTSASQVPPRPTAPDKDTTTRRFCGPGSAEHAVYVLEQMGEQPKTTKSNHYQIVYVCSPAIATQRRILLEKLRTQFLGFARGLRMEIHPPPDRLVVVILETQAQMEAFDRLTRPDGEPIPSYVAGYYVHELNWAVFYNQHDSYAAQEGRRRLAVMQRSLEGIQGTPATQVRITFPDGRTEVLTKAQLARQITLERRRMADVLERENQRVTQHECAHQLAFNVGIQKRNVPYPFWVSEGLACVFESPGKTGTNRVGAAHINEQRLAGYRKLARAKRAHRLADLLTITGREPGLEVDAIYNESWAMFSFLFTRYRAQLGQYLQALASRGRDPNRNNRPTTGDPRPDPIDETAEFEKFFGKDLTKLQNAFERYIATIR